MIQEYAQKVYNKVVGKFKNMKKIILKTFYALIKLTILMLCLLFVFNGIVIVRPYDKEISISFIAFTIISIFLFLSLSWLLITKYKNYKLITFVIAIFSYVVICNYNTEVAYAFAHDKCLDVNDCPEGMTLNGE